MQIKKALSVALRKDLRLLLRSVHRTLHQVRNGSGRVRCKVPAGAKLNLGCGRLVVPGWINLDEIAHDRSVLVHDLRNPLPFGDAEIEHIHCEHTLEHVHFDEAKQLLLECRRVLRPSGTLRIIVPDAERYMRAYCAGDREFFASVANLGGAESALETPNAIINQMFRMGGSHRYAWDFATLELELQRAGFSNIHRSELNHVLPEYRIDGSESWRAVESLYVNAQRKG